MGNFSERNGITKPKDVIQKEFMTEELRNSLWNALCMGYFDKMTDYLSPDRDGSYELLIRVWINFFKKRVDEIPRYQEKYKKFIKNHFFECRWNEVYNLIEFFPNNFKPEYSEYDNRNSDFIDYCNELLEREVSAYRFVNGLLSEITSQEQIESIESALKTGDKFAPVAVHLNTALKFFSDKENPDYRNSIKESISAVESYLCILTGKSNLPFSHLLKEIESNLQIHRALKSAFNNLYGFTSDSSGIRHALLEESDLKSEDAKFMLVTCSAFINYLKQKQ